TVPRTVIHYRVPRYATLKEGGLPADSLYDMGRTKAPSQRELSDLLAQQEELTEGVLKDF
ncbi:MAG: hypothetical protein IKO92_02150, partial [Clostridia bacterium]|nr:hypothetical protein [Clostridia bacterium]